MILRKTPSVAIFCAATLSLVVASSPSDAPGAHDQPGAAAASGATGSPTPAEAALADRAVMETAAAPALVRRVETVGKGDTLAAILDRAALSRVMAHDVAQALGQVYDLRRFRPGQRIEMTLRPDADGGSPTLERLVLKVDPRTDAVVSANPDGAGFTARSVHKELAREVTRAAGTIHESLYVAANRSGVPATGISDLIRVFSWDVDFQRDIRDGDDFEMVYDQLIDEDGRVVGTGAIRVAVMTLSGDRRVLYRHELADGRIDYFDEQGRGARKALMRTPINGARLSSGFGKRRHPILGYSKMHKGVDFAAPTGTPIFAAGDGVIEKRGRNGGYGNYIRLRHNGTYSTAYAHLSRFAKSVYVGKRVRQGDVIGYVGSTGRSTGPHLHYEILKNGRQVNPMRVRMPSGEKLTGTELARFEETRAVTDRLWAAIAADAQVARAD